MSSLFSFLLRRPHLAAAAAVLLAAGTFLLPGLAAPLSACCLSLLLTGCALCRKQARAWRFPWQLARPLHELRHLTIDGSLLLSPRCVTQVRIPFDSLPAPRMGPGTLLWASAATVTCSLAPEEDQDAIRAALAPLGFAPEKFLTRCPVQRQITHEGLEGFIVRDGNGSRAYFTGDAASVLRCCTQVWDQQERGLTDDDRLRLTPAEGALRGLAMAAVEDGTPAALTYLGALQVGRRPLEDPPLLKQLGRRFTYTITPAACAPELARDLRALSLAEDVPERTLHVSPRPAGENSFTVEDPDTLADQLLQGHDRALAEDARVDGLLLRHAMLLLLALILGVPAWLLLPAGLLLLPAHLHAPLRLYDLSGPAWRPILPVAFTAAWALLWPWAVHSFVQYAAPDALAACGVMAFTAAAAGLWLIPPLHAPAPAQGAWRYLLPAALLCLAAAWLVTAPDVIPGAFGILAGALTAAVTALVQHIALRP